MRKRSLAVDVEEHRSRIARVRSELGLQGLDVLVTFGPHRIAYLSGFFHWPTERPIALVLPLDGDPALLVPRIEQEHATLAPLPMEQWVYHEYPRGAAACSPLEHLATCMRKAGLAGGHIGTDLPGYEHRQGYVGPTLAQIVPEATVIDVPELVDALRRVKSPTEISLMRESARWGGVAHRALQDGVEIGKSAIETALRATADATVEMLRELGSPYRQRALFGSPVFLVLNGGTNTAHAHGFAHGSGIQPGDVLVSGALAEVGGYWTELERTMIVGEPAPALVAGFERMLAAQDAAFAAIRPGRTCSDVETEIDEAIRAAGWAEQRRHHTGHGIGLDFHEQPFLDLGDDTPIEPGMTFTVEPALYIPRLAGFRHSDTVVVTASGIERLTSYPRDLESLVIPC